MRSPVEIGDKSFKTLTEAINFTRDFLLDLENIGNMIITPTSEHWDYFYSLILRHPRADEKLEDGVKSFRVVRNYSNSIATELRTIGGNFIHFGWRTCINRRDNSEKVKLATCMRRAIRSQKDAFFEGLEDPRCIFCNKPLSDQVDVHHIDPSFKELSDAFIKQNPLPANPFITEENDSSVRYRFRDFGYEHDWKGFHKQNAELTPAHRDCHQKYHSSK